MVIYSVIKSGYFRSLLIANLFPQSIAWMCLQCYFHSNFQNFTFTYYFINKRLIHTRSIIRREKFAWSVSLSINHTWVLVKTPVSMWKTKSKGGIELIISGSKLVSWPLNHFYIVLNIVERIIQEGIKIKYLKGMKIEYGVLCNKYVKIYKNLFWRFEYFWKLKIKYGCDKELFWSVKGRFFTKD